MKFVLCVSLSLALLVGGAACEFSFGEKQEPILKATANPGIVVDKPYNPELLSEKMTEDLTDRGWQKKPTLIRNTADKVTEFIKKQAQAEIMQGFSIKSITAVPYANEVDIAKTVTLVFYDVGNPLNAYSLFTRIRQLPMSEYYYGEREIILQENSAAFWEGPLYIMVATANLGDDTRDVLLGIAKGISYKLYGMIGTYGAPDLAGLFPAFERKDHSLQVSPGDPFDFAKPEELPEQIMQAVYNRAAGESTLYIFKDPSADRILNYRNRMIARLFLHGTKTAAILASVYDEKQASRIWVNSPDYGIVEVALQGGLLSVHTGIGAYIEGLAETPGYRQVARSKARHEIYAARVTLNTYKDMIVVAGEDAKTNTIIMLGVTDDVLREARN
jgi:hypothetical protein